MFVASSTCVFEGLQEALAVLIPLGIRALEVYELNIPVYLELQHIGIAGKTNAELAALRESLEAQGAFLCAISGHTDLLAPDDEGRSESVQHLQRCLVGAEALGCPVVVTASGHAKGDPHEEMKHLVTGLQHLGDVAGEHGVTLAVEAHYGEFIQSTQDVVDLMERVGHPRVGINYDPFHFVFQDEDLTTSAQLAARWVVHTHIHDVRPSPPPGVYVVEWEEIPGRGVIPWPVVCEALHSAGYEGALSIELHKVFADLVTDHRVSRDYLAELLRGLGTNSAHAT